LSKRLDLECFDDLPQKLGNDLVQIPNYVDHEEQVNRIQTVDQLAPELVRDLVVLQNCELALG